MNKVNYTQADIRKPHKDRLVSTVILDLSIALFAGVEIGAEMAQSGVDFFDAILSDSFLGRLESMQVLHIWPCDISAIGLCLVAAMIAILPAIDKYNREKDVDISSAHGTGGFEDDYKSFYRHYVLAPSFVGKTKRDRYVGGQLLSAKVDSFTGHSPQVGKLLYIWHVYYLSFISLICGLGLSVAALSAGQTKQSFFIFVAASGIAVALAIPAKLTIKDRLLTKKNIDYAKTNCQILSNDIMISLDCKFTQRNLNTFYFGASGTGKSRFAVRPNLLQANSSYIITDPSGELLESEGGFLKSQGYKIRILNLKDMTESCQYNPFEYVQNQQEIPILMQCLKNNIDKGKSGGGDSQFWDQSVLALLTACGSYLYEVFNEDEEFLYDANGNKIPETNPSNNGPKFLTTVNITSSNYDTDFLYDADGKKVQSYKRNPRWKGHRNLTNVMNMLRMGKIIEDGDNTVPNDLDNLFADWEFENPESYAVKQYKTFKMAPSKTALNIMISISVLLGTYFDLPAVEYLTYQDGMDIRGIGQEKTAVFLILPEGGNNPFAFISAMFYSQVFSILYAEGEQRAKEQHLSAPELAVPVRIFFDEMANIGVIPEFQEKLATMRKYRISANPIFQSLSQLKKIYEKDYNAIIENCDSMVFLGGSGAETLEMLSKKLGKKTIETMSYGNSKSKQSSTSDNRQQIGRNVLDPNEIEQMYNTNSLVFIRGSKPFYTKKYTLEEHPNYKKSEELAHTITSVNFKLTCVPEYLESTLMYAPSDKRYDRPIYKGNRYQFCGKIQNVDRIAGGTYNNKDNPAVNVNKDNKPSRSDSKDIRADDNCLSPELQQDIESYITSAQCCMPPTFLKFLIDKPKDSWDSLASVYNGYSPDYEFKDETTENQLNGLLPEMTDNEEETSNDDKDDDTENTNNIEEEPEDIEETRPEDSGEAEEYTDPIGLSTELPF